MKILLSIKSVLNYLYNHLIELIWVRVLRFSDGTEMTTVPTGNNLLDIKLLSQAIADKGFAYMCHTNRRDLAKADVPTLYNDILNKYLNAEEHTTSLQAGLNKDNNRLANLCYINNKLYFTENDNVFYSLSYTSGSGIVQVNNISNIRKMYQGNNCIIALSPFTAYKINPTDNSVIELGSIQDTDFNGIFKVFNGKIYFIPYDNSNESKYTKIYEFVDDNSSNTMVTYNYNGYVSDVDFYDGYYYLVSLNDNVRYILKGLNLGNNDLADTSKWELVKQINNGSYDKYYTQIFFAEDKCVLFVFCGGLRGYDYYVLDINTFDTIYNTGYNQFGPYMSQIVLCDNIFYGVKKELNFESRDLFTYCSVFDITNKSNWVTDSELSDFDRPYDIVFDGFLVLPTLQLFSIHTSSSKEIYYRGITKTVYTDSYTINGTTVNIDYYKFEDFKICIKDNGTNDTNLETVFNYLSYLNYWLLDTVNETVAIQRDKNTYAVMFVGDDFIDDNNDLDTNDYASVVLKNQLNNLAVPSITFFDSITGVTLNTGLTLGNSTLVYKNGLLLQPTEDYTVSGSTITFVTALVSTDKIAVINGNTSALDLSAYRLKADTVEIDTASITISEIKANTNYVFTNANITDITFNGCQTSFEETTIEFSTGSSAPTLTDNSGITWVDGSAPTLNANKNYIIVIFNKKGLVREY